MALPVNIDDLINSKTVESTRKEIKKGWNPEEIMHSICAFANDINELGGGYIIIGLEEKDGIPILPPTGLQHNQLDTIQKKFLELCHKIQPKIFPVIETIEFQGKFIILIWVTTGEERPYDCPSTLGQRSQRRIYVRPSSVTIPANFELEKRLREIASYKHFDDRINAKASLDDLDLELILSYLKEAKAQLANEASDLSFKELCQKMGIVRGPNENIKPLNVGLLLFNKEPEKYFEGCYTNLVEFEEDESGIAHSAKVFKGPIHIQIKQIMEYLNTNILREYTKKTKEGLKSTSFVNYSFRALREAIVNSLYHRSYENPTPNEIRIYKHSFSRNGEDLRRIEIHSYPGPLPPIDEEALVQLNITARNYRNIRLGDWLKGIHLAEKFATGIPTIISELDKNGSPRPLLSTDASKSCFTIVLKIHPDTPIDKRNNQREMEYLSLTDLQQRILESIEIEPQNLKELFKEFDSEISPELDFLTEKGLIGIKKVAYSRFMFSHKTNRLYFITNKGRDALNKSF